MKSFLISLFVAAILVAGSLAYSIHLEKCSSELGGIADSISDALDTGDFTTAIEKTDLLHSKLEHAEPFISAFGNHQDIDLIETNLAELEVYSHNQSKNDALARARVLVLLFDHLPKNTRIKIENIL